LGGRAAISPNTTGWLFLCHFLRKGVGIETERLDIYDDFVGIHIEYGNILF